MVKKTLESSLDSKEIKLVNPKGKQSWIFIGRLMLKLKLQYFDHIMWKANLLGKKKKKNSDAGKDWGQEEKRATEVGCLHQFNGALNELEQTLGDSEGQGSLVYCSPWVAKSQTWLSDLTTA